MRMRGRLEGRIVEILLRGSGRDEQIDDELGTSRPGRSDDVTCDPWVPLHPGPSVSYKLRTFFF